MKVRAAGLPTGAQTPAARASSTQAAWIQPLFVEQAVGIGGMDCRNRKFTVNAGKRHFCPGPALTVDIA
jgi:hypothetical protein